MLTECVGVEMLWSKVAFFFDLNINYFAFVCCSVLAQERFGVLLLQIKSVLRLIPRFIFMFHNHHAAVPYHIQTPLQGKYRKQKQKQNKNQKFFPKEATTMRKSLISYKHHCKENVENKKDFFFEGKDDVCWS